MGGNNDASKKLTNALDAFYKVDPDADGVLLVGDVTNNGADSEYDTLMGIVNASEFGKAGKVELSMGNMSLTMPVMRWIGLKPRLNRIPAKLSITTTKAVP